MDQKPAWRHGGNSELREATQSANFEFGLPLTSFLIGPFTQPDWSGKGWGGVSSGASVNMEPWSVSTGKTYLWNLVKNNWHPQKEAAVWPCYPWGVSSLLPQNTPWPECMLYNLRVNQPPQPGCLKDALERLLPLWNERIAPEVLSGKTILISTRK